MDYFRSKRFLDTLPDWEAGRPAPGPPEQYLPRVRALLGRLGDPQQSFRSVIVGGTNGKGTVSSLLANLLQAAGHRVGLYTSPHLHTQRERIRLNGEPSTKDLWAEGIGRLYDRTREFETEGCGPFTRFEALTALAAHLFAAEGVEFGIFEVGMGGRYDATNAWDSELAVLTSIGLDHVEVLGGTLLEIAADKLRIARPGHPFFTTESQAPQVLALIRQESRKLRLRLHVAGSDGVAVPDGTVRPYPWNPAAMPDRPRTYRENARLALAAGAYLLGDRLSPELARRVVEQHHWPGRFEVARRQPLVLLDGAHNPAAAAALAADLERIAPKWTFVVGGSAGHDAAGVLAAFQPLAEKVVLTSSDHPRALAAETLAQRAPDGLRVEQEPSWSRALARVLAASGPASHLCVTGSLYLVARAREFFDLPGERDGITEDMALESLHCLEIACRNLGFSCQPVSADGNLVRVSRGERSVYFLRNKHPFNDYVAGRLAEDKGYQGELFARAGLPAPATLQVFNPLADARFDRYRTHGSIAAAVADAEQRFSFPIVVKKHQSSLAQGVFLEPDRERLE
jgi:dihydrofolate synthase / folylpolyglutamate synthase